MEKILENTLLLMILPWIFVWGILCILEKRKRKNENGNKDENRYVIQNDDIFFPLFSLGFYFHFAFFIRCFLLNLIYRK